MGSEIIVQAAKESTRRRGPDHLRQRAAKDFKDFIRNSGTTHVRTSPYYPQSNGKIEHYNNGVGGGSTPVYLREPGGTPPHFTRQLRSTGSTKSRAPACSIPIYQSFDAEL